MGWKKKELKKKMKNVKIFLTRYYKIESEKKFFSLFYIFIYSYIVFSKKKR